MVNISVGYVDTMVDDQSIVLLDESHEMRNHTPRLQPPAPAPWPKPWSVTHNSELWRLIPSMGSCSWGLWCHENLAQRCQLCEKLRLPETLRMWMWISSFLANRQVATASPKSLSLMSLSLMSLSLISLSQMFISVGCARMAQYARSAAVLALQRRRWLLGLG